MLFTRVSPIARRSTGSVRKVSSKQGIGNSNYGFESERDLAKSVVAMRTDGLPDGWVLRLHTRSTDYRKGQNYRTLKIRNNGSSAVLR